MGVDNSGVASSGKLAASDTASKSGSGTVGAASGALSSGKLAASGVLSILDSTDDKGRRKPVM